ncbi:MAG: MogA/MoaB family molybdenum cofactor biosynthesis protein [Dehalococcoidales bacterium]|nr:MogA/MoaB family molybdenum cofactor biosynthesis protein [Dehalococcoidales bacterium]
MGYQEHRQRAPRSLVCAVITISDSRTEETDESGKFLKQKLSENGHQVTAYAILKNDALAIRRTLFELLGQEELQVIITSGGTGLSYRDLTVETVSPILEKKLDGFGELFRHLSYQEIGTAGIMSRAIAGVAGRKVVICLPGSLGAAKTAMDKIILPEVGHMVREATE